MADGSGGKLHIVASLGRLLEPVGLPRYAAICGGSQTAAVPQAYQGGGREGFREFRRAQERSGVELRTCPGLGCGRTPPSWLSSVTSHSGTALRDVQAS